VLRRLIKGGTVDATFIEFLVDPVKEVRWLGAIALDDWGKEFRENPEMAKQVVAAARAETVSEVGRFMGNIVGKIDVAKTGLADDIKKLLAESRNGLMRQC
jgi:hypothetical protein